MTNLVKYNGIVSASVKKRNWLASASWKKRNWLSIVQPVTWATYWYFCWWVAGTGIITDRITFSTWVTAAYTAANLTASMNQWSPWGISDKTTYWYISWGQSTGSPYAMALTNRITFSTSATAAYTAGNLSVGKDWLAWLSDWATYWYWAWWRTSNSLITVATTDRLTFSTWANAANTASNLSTVRWAHAWLSDWATYGYWGGGISSARTALTDRVTFSTWATAANTVSNVQTPTDFICWISDWATYWYWTWWRTGADANSVLTSRITFATWATAANSVSNLNTARHWILANSDGNLYWYFAWWYSSTYSAVTERITFSTGATAANTVSNLSAARYLGSWLSDFAI